MALLAACVLTSPLAAQTVELWVQADAAHARPPVGVPALEATSLGLFGARLHLDRAGALDLDLSLFGGRGATPADGVWFDGAVGAGTVWRTGRYAGGARAEAFGLTYTSPVDYTLGGASLSPWVSRAFDAFVVTLDGELIRGRWSVPFAPGPIEPDGARLAAGATGGALALSELGLTVARAVGPLRVEARASTASARNAVAPGVYRSLEAAVHGSHRGVMATLGASWSVTPNGDEAGLVGSTAFRINDRLRARLSVARHGVDPLYGHRRGVVASLGLSWRAVSRELRRSPPVIELAESVADGRRVHFRLKADAAQVALAGDFTNWMPRLMERSGTEWSLELVLEPGLHHFGFVLDGERWFVPDHAPGIVDDGWGRRNASVYVPRER